MQELPGVPCDIHLFLTRRPKNRKGGRFPLSSVIKHLLSCDCESSTLLLPNAVTLPCILTLVYNSIWLNLFPFYSTQFNLIQFSSTCSLAIHTTRYSLVWKLVKQKPSPQGNFRDPYNCNMTDAEHQWLQHRRCW